MPSEKRKLIHSLVFPAIFIFVIWIVKFSEIVFNIDLKDLGVYPRSVSGLIGITTSPFIHADFSHLIANSLPLFFLSTFLFYFYREIAYKIFFLIFFVTGIWVWFGARESFHIGASGIVYGLASFLFFSGIIRKNTKLMGITLVIAFLYGSMIWGIFPEFFPEKNISWESHLSGLLCGLIFAYYYRNRGPKIKKYEWEDEDDDEEDDKNQYWKLPSVDLPGKVKYHYKEK